MNRQQSAEIVWVEATTLDDLWEDEILRVDVLGEPVLLVHLTGGALRAYQGNCPHQQLSLDDGEWDPDEGQLVCSGHHWRFDLVEGVGINPAGCRLYAYPVELDGDVVRVGVPQDGQRHYNRCREQEST
jgi:toluene monooxygenase system ferredoxin subunit